MFIKSIAELVEQLREQGLVLWAPPSDPYTGEIQANHLGGDSPDALAGGTRALLIAAEPGTYTGPLIVEGLAPARSDFAVSEALYEEMCRVIQDDKSALRRHSSRPIIRTFVYLDVSDFSKMATGIQLLAISALVQMTKALNPDLGSPEARLCIGDGYIFVFEHSDLAIVFAAHLAQRIELDRAQKIIPEIHFRIGIHVGLVRCFWDPGLVGGWNYIGDGINGGQRVLSAIGKETDDVVFISGQVRDELLKSPLSNWAREIVLKFFENKGRRLDKHGRPWRVYQLNHTAVDLAFVGIDVNPRLLP